MHALSTEALDHVIGGASAGTSNRIGTSGFTAGPASLSTRLGATPAIGACGPTTGGQSFETSHAGPSALERVNTSFDNSTRVMRTFNDTFGFVTQAPGFGNGDVMAP